MATNKNFIVKNGLDVSGTANLSTLNLTGSLTGPATFTIDPAAIGDNTGTVVIAGDLQVDGTSTTINSTTLLVEDKNITLARTASNSSAANAAGITIAGANADLTYFSSGDKWSFNKQLEVLTPTSTTSSLTLTETGAVTSIFKSTGSAGFIGAVTNHPFNIIQNNVARIVLNTSGHVELLKDLQLNSVNPRIDYDNNDSSGSLRLYSTSRGATSHQFYPNGHAHFITTSGTFKIEGLGSTSNQIESGGSLKIRAVSGHVDLLDGTTEVLNTNTTGVTLPLNLVVNGKLGINENSLSANARLQVRYDNSQSYNAFNALTNPSMIIKNLTAGASKFTSLGFITESNGEGAISLVQGSGNINADMTFSLRSSGTRAEHLRITHDGNVGIGTSTPLVNLHVNGTNASIGVLGTPKADWYTTAYNGLQVADGLTLWGRANDSHMSGNYYVKSVSGIAKDSYINNGYAHDLWFDNASGDLKYRNAASGSANGEITSFPTRLVIKNNGDVGIGTTDTYGRKFAVEGTGDLMMLRSTNSGAGGAQLDLIHDSASAANNDSVGIINFSSDTMQYASIKGVSSNVGDEGEFHIGVRESSSTYNHDAVVVSKDANVRIGRRLHIGYDVTDTRLTIGSTGTENTNSSSWVRSSSGNLMFNAGSSSHVWELNGAQKMNLGTNGRLTFVGTGNTEGISLGANHRIYGGTNRAFEAATTATGQISIGEGYSSGTVKVYSKFVLGTFSNSTVNSGEAWIGRASDRQDGTMTIQLGGNDHTGTKFEIVDRAWSKVMYSFSGEAPGGTISTQSQGYMHVGSQQSTAFLYLGSQGGAFGGNSSHWLRASGTNFMLNAAGGNYLFEISGTQRGYINASGFNNGSDVALKENIEDIEYGINTVNQLRPRKFDRIDAPDIDKAEVGFIAQEVEPIIPELISNSKPEGSTGQIVKGMNYGALTSVLVKAIQEQQVIIDDLKSRIEVLEG